MEKRKEWEKGKVRGHVPGEYHHPIQLRASSTSNPHPLTVYPHPRRPPSSRIDHPGLIVSQNRAARLAFCGGAQTTPLPPPSRTPPTTTTISTPPKPVPWGSPHRITAAATRHWSKPSPTARFCAGDLRKTSRLIFFSGCFFFHITYRTVLGFLDSVTTSQFNLTCM